MLPLLVGKTRLEIVAQLREQVGRLELAGEDVGDDAWRCSSGCPDLDRLLPGGGIRRGTLVEWLSPGAGSGAGTLALCMAREACRDGGALVIVDRRGEFYPPAAAGWGIDLTRTLIVRPVHQADDQWAVDQALRCAGVRAVLSWPERLGDHTFRRWQLAALAGGSVGLLVRPDTTATSPSWAEVRLLVCPLSVGGNSVADGCSFGAAIGDGVASCNRRNVHIELLRCRGGTKGGALELEIDDETGVVRLAAELAPATAAQRAAGA